MYVIQFADGHYLHDTQEDMHDGTTLAVSTEDVEKALPFYTITQALTISAMIPESRVVVITE